MNMTAYKQKIKRINNPPGVIHHRMPCDRVCSAGRSSSSGRCNAIKNRRGSALVVALMALLVLSAVGLMVSITVSEDLDVARNHIEIVKCLYLCEAGLDFSLSKLASNPSWTGLPGSGRTIGPGYFTVFLSDSSAEGVPLSSGQKRINVKARIGTAEREIEAIVQ